MYGNFEPRICFCQLAAESLIKFFENTKIRIVDQHKHLGLTLSSSAQWNDHINNSLETASKVIHIMCRLQFTLTCAALNQIYLSYVIPILEYASIVWDGCSKTSSDSIEKLQNEAARLVTGLTRSVSLEKIYKECGWETLDSRRKSFKLHFMFKVSNNLVPHYKEEPIRPLVGNRTKLKTQNIISLSVPAIKISEPRFSGQLGLFIL